MGCTPIRRSLPIFFVLCLLVLADSATPAEPAEAPPASAEPAGWHFSRYTGDGRAWFPEDQFSNEPQKAPFMVMYEVSRFPFRLQPTAAEKAAGQELIERSRAAAEEKGWFDYETARADGFELLFRDEVHYFHREHLRDGKTLDPERPEFLMFYDTAEGKKLVGLMFLVSEPGERGPQIGGPDTVWHYHIWSELQCLEDGLRAVADPDEDGRCARGIATHKSPEMLHLWFIEHPEGPFATNMTLPDWVLGSVGHHH